MAAEWLLLSGASRSGTTFLNALLNTHPRIALFTETGIDTIVSSIRRCLSEGLIVSDSRLTPTNTPPRQQDVDLVAEAIYAARFDKPNLSLIGDKMPNVDRNIVAIYRSCVGRMRTIYIVRNPVDVVASSMQRRAYTALGADAWHIASVEEAIVEWALNWEHLASLRDDPDVLAVSYERFDVDAASEIARVADFLELDAAGFRRDFFNRNAMRLDSCSPDRLSADEIGTVRSVLGPVAAMLPCRLEDALQRSPFIYPHVALGTKTIIDDGAPIAALFFKTGFSLLEPWGVWTDGHDAVMGFRVDDTVDKIKITLEITPFIGNGTGFELRITSRTTSRDFVIDSAINRAFIDFECAPGQDGTVRLDLHMPSIKTPLDEPTFDPRALGIGLFSFQVQAV